ncbi:cold shock protein 1-like [Schistocerca piceifrons]|uniref:cold shock protein 1-like n=1 Tax=Schistocerca piceifrons TaxID=274613 RepID=UPI001F5F0917|nr:cold shock protein 1-like [Schistocerca piceifrons]
MQGHLAKFDEVQIKMSMLNKPIDEADLCARFLQTLPKEFDYIYITWHDLPQADKTWHKLQKRCLNYEVRIQDREETNVAAAMFSRTKGSVSTQQRSKIKLGNAKKVQNSTNRDVKKCFSGGKFGHISKDCKTGIVCFKCKSKGHISRNCPSGGGGGGSAMYQL